MEIVVTGVKPYDGRYPFDIFEDELTTREWGWVKRLSGYMPLTIAEGLEGGDPELVTVFAAIALRRAGKIDASELTAIFERLADAPFGAAITLETNGEPVEDDAGPPVRSSNGSGFASGERSNGSSEPSGPPQKATGTLGSAISESALTTSGT